MAEAKTKPTEDSADNFVSQIEDESRRRDCEILIGLMREATGTDAVMWGPSIIGFGSYHYRYETGREGDGPLVGFSPRKAALTLYLSIGFDPSSDLLGKLGKHTTGKGCLYIKRLSDIDQNVLRDLLLKSIERSRQLWGAENVHLSKAKQPL